MKPLVFLEEIDGELISTWELRFDNNGLTPGAGDVFLVSTRKPFTPEDVYRFKTVAATADEVLASQELQDIYVVPNPYGGHIGF